MVASACRDAKFCVSRGRNAYVLSVFIACACWYGLDGRRKILRLYLVECVCFQRIIACACWYGLLVRRKILRLYLVECIYGKSVTSCLWRMLAARRQRVMAGRVRRSSVCALAFAKVAGDVIVCKAHLFVARVTPFCLSCHGRTCVILLNLLARSAAQPAYVGAGRTAA